jgi:curved DNA-binding protein CbpA
MTDPYQVLGVSPSASEEEIKTAYRELVRKYHPDNYVGNPLADLANDRMQEINQAYDQVMNLRRGQSGGSSSGYAGSSSTQFADIRKLITGHRITEAEELLDGVPGHLRDAEWHFLKGTVQYSRGWLDDAFANFSTACNMDPGNAEYRAALNQLQWQRQSGRAPGYRTNQNAQNCDICDVCAAAYCASCCCDCMH